MNLANRNLLSQRTLTVLFFISPSSKIRTFSETLLVGQLNFKDEMEMPSLLQRPGHGWGLDGWQDARPLGECRHALQNTPSCSAKPGNTPRVKDVAGARSACVPEFSIAQNKWSPVVIWLAVWGLMVIPSVNKRPPPPQGAHSRGTGHPSCQSPFSLSW